MRAWVVMAHGAICRLVCDDICLGYKVIGALPSVAYAFWGPRWCLSDHFSDCALTVVDLGRLASPVLF